MFRFYKYFYLTATELDLELIKGELAVIRRGHFDNN